MRTLKNEVWKDIEGFEGKYQVSNMGRIKRLNYHNTKKPRINTPTKDARGRLITGLWKDNKIYRPRVARLVFETFNDTKLNRNQFIQHKDGNTKNCHLDNLYVMSCKDTFKRDFESGKRFAETYDFYSAKITRKEASRIAGINRLTIESRLQKLKWNIYEAIETPVYLTSNSNERRKTKCQIATKKQ